MAEKFDTFKVTVLGWTKHNEKKKKGHQYIMLSTRFFDDHKVSLLTPQQKLAYIYLLLRCGDETQGTVVATSKQMRSACGANTLRVESTLKALQSFQLVRIEESHSLKTLHYKTSKDITSQDKKSQEGPTAPQQKPPTELNKKIWAVYQESYLRRYKVDPVRNASVNAQISQLAKRLGEEAIEVVKFYVSHNDTFYVSKAHAIGLCLKDAESLRTQWMRGAQITRSGLKRFEANVQQQELLNAIDRGEV